MKAYRLELIIALLALAAIYPAYYLFGYFQGNIILFSAQEKKVVLPDGRKLPTNRWLNEKKLFPNSEGLSLLQSNQMFFLIVNQNSGAPVTSGSISNAMIKVDSNIYHSAENKTRFWISIHR